MTSIEMPFSSKVTQTKKGKTRSGGLKMTPPGLPQFCKERSIIEEISQGKKVTQAKTGGNWVKI